MYIRLFENVLFIKGIKIAFQVVFNVLINAQQQDNRPFYADTEVLLPRPFYYQMCMKMITSVAMCLMLDLFDARVIVSKRSGEELQPTENKQLWQ